MKKLLIIIVVSLVTFPGYVFSQSDSTIKSCKMFMEGKVILDVTLEDALKWMEMVPPTVQCDNNKVYKLNTFVVNFMTLKPFVNKDFGIGEGGFPIMAVNAVKNAKSGDTIILKDATYIDGDGNTGKLPVISVKIK